jgi:NAD(P)-dependent dehydrogenase (short-subunit alcohol dehydrogenase family)
MPEKVTLVTGTTGGIGEALVRRLLTEGWRVVMVNRDEARAIDLRKRLIGEHPAAQIDLVNCNLADHGEIRRAAKVVLERYPRLEAVFLNAGVLIGEKRMSTQGNEMHFEVNTLAPYMLMRLLLPAVQAARGVFVVTSSGVITTPKKLKLDELRNPKQVGKLFGAYAQSKLAAAMMVSGLALEYEPLGVVCRSADPGPNKTSMTAGSGMPWFLLLLRPLIFKAPEVGARHVHDAAVSPAYGTKTGIFIATGTIKALPTRIDQPEVRRNTLALCRELTGL